MQIRADWIEKPSVKAAMQMLTDAGHQALFVGGCIRNAVLDEGETDIDIATDAEPQTVIDLAKAAGIRAVPTGVEHGTVTLVIEKMPLEVTTFRRDIETDGRRAVVAFSKDIKDDARRRDFTMNALYADSDGTVIDPLGGWDDLQKRHVRFIENPNQRIKEDYLRILRFFRFTALYGDPELGIDADGLAACAAFLHGIKTLSKERVGHEMRKLLTAPQPARALAAMELSGVLAHVLPGADVRAIPILINLEDQYGFEPDWITRLACLGGEEVQKNLSLSKVENKELSSILSAIEKGLRPSVVAYRYSGKIALSAQLALSALTEQPLMPDLKTQIDKGATVVFPIKASDLGDQLSGKALGDRLRSLEQDWIRSDFALTKKELLS